MYGRAGGFYNPMSYDSSRASIMQAAMPMPMPMYGGSMMSMAQTPMMGGMQQSPMMSMMQSPMMGMGQ